MASTFPFFRPALAPKATLTVEALPEMPDWTVLAQAAYDAYRVALMPAVFPAWEALPPDQWQAWEAVILAVDRALRSID